MTKNILDLSLTILVVDDVVTVRRVMRKLLGQIGFTHITEAANGEEALSYVGQNKVDLIISDWNMPKLCGIDLLNKMKANPRLKDIPVIMITANNSHGHVVEAAKAGVAGFICKPFSVDTLKSRIEEAFVPNSSQK